MMDIASRQDPGLYGLIRKSHHGNHWFTLTNNKSTGNNWLSFGFGDLKVHNMLATPSLLYGYEIPL
jgi:hypothetical protein